MDLASLRELVYGSLYVDLGNLRELVCGFGQFQCFRELVSGLGQLVYKEIDVPIGLELVSGLGQLVYNGLDK